MKFAALISLFLLFVPQQTPVEYLEMLNQDADRITKDTWSYVRQGSTGNNVRRLERTRLDLVKTLYAAKQKVTMTPGYNGDVTLKRAFASYLDVQYNVIANNYKQVVDMERIAEESYDAMEAYIMLKEAINEKLDSASDKLKVAVRDYAVEHNITLVSNDDRLSKKLKVANKVNIYGNRVFLIFYKSNWYEGKMMEAYNASDVGGMEQYRQTLEAVSKEGMEEISKLETFEGDPSLKNACYKMLEFYYGEAKRYMPDQIAFFVKQDKFQSLSKSMEKRKKGSLTQAEIDEYNLAVKEYNSSIKGFNETNEYLNKYRSSRLENFNDTKDKFYNRHF